MSLNNSTNVAERAKKQYESVLRVQLEQEHKNEFVAIEPDSGDYFLSNSFSEAIQKAKRKHPDKISFVLRVGHPAAIHLGLLAS